MFEDPISVQYLEENPDKLHNKVFRVIKIITMLTDDVVLFIISNPKQLFLEKFFRLMATETKAESIF